MDVKAAIPSPRSKENFRDFSTARVPDRPGIRFITVEGFSLIRRPTPENRDALPPAAPGADLLRTCQLPVGTSALVSQRSDWELATGNSATRPTDKRRARRGLARRDVAATLDGVSLFDIGPTVTDLLRKWVLPLRAIWP